jgi:hypothetical protein
MLRCASIYIALMLGGSVQFGVVAAFQFIVAALALDVAPPIAEHPSVVGDRLCIQFDFVLYFHCSNTLVHLSLRSLFPH